MLVYMLDNSYLCRNMSNFNTINKTTTINEDGEILDQRQEITQVFTKKISTEKFLQVYLNDLSGLFQLNSSTEIKLLSLMWRDSRYNDDNSDIGNIVYTIKDLKEQWVKEMGSSMGTINNTITKLVTKGLLISKPKSRSVYYLNPQYFFKGNTKDLPKVKQVLMQYISE